MLKSILKKYALKAHADNDPDMLAKFKQVYPNGYKDYIKVVNADKKLGFYKMWAPVIGAEVVSGIGSTFTDNRGRTWDLKHGKVWGTPTLID